MNYLQGISLKALTIGFIVGYFIPYIFLKIFAYILVALGISHLSGIVPMLILVLMLVISPLASGYFGARYSVVLPQLNGLLATTAGISAFIYIRNMQGVTAPLIIIVLGFLFGYLGAKRYIKYG